MPLLRKPPPLKNQRTEILGLPVDVLPLKDVLDRIAFYFTDPRPHQIITINSLLTLEAKKNPILREACRTADLVIPDSSGMIWAAHHLSRPIPVRVPGIDLAFQMCSLAEVTNTPIYLLGGKPGVAMRAAEFLYKNFPYLSIGGMRDGYFKDHDIPTIVQDIEESRARLTLIAFGMPKQDVWIYKHLQNLPNGVFMGVGGTFDVWSGDLKRAPRMFRNLGIEWLFRLGQQPHRIRQMAHLPRFALEVIRNA